MRVLIGSREWVLIGSRGVLRSPILSLPPRLSRRQILIVTPLGLVIRLRLGTLQARKLALLVQLLRRGRRARKRRRLVKVKGLKVICGELIEGVLKGQYTEQKERSQARLGDVPEEK